MIFTLVQCFADTAHNPYTNARPASTAVAAVLGGGYQAPPVAPSSGPTPAPLPASTALVIAASESAGAAARALVQDPSKTNIMSHLPRPKPYQPFQVIRFVLSGLCKECRA